MLVGYVAAIAYLIWLSRRGIDIRGIGLGKKTEKAKGIGRTKAIGLLLLSLAMIIVGSELLVHGATSMIEQFGLSQTFIGMTVVALAISIEEVARELPAAMRGHPEISFGNVAGSVLTFFLFNAGIIALIRPLEVNPATMQFYLPVTIATVVLISASLFFWTPLPLGRRASGPHLYRLRNRRLSAYGVSPAGGAERGEQGRQSKREARILRIVFPRSDLDVRIGDVPVSAELALTSWYGFWPMPDGTMRLMGDTIVREDELAGVLDEVHQQGLRITAIHNHLANESPNILYAHIAGRGNGAALARKIKAVLARTGTPMTEAEEKEDSSAVDGPSVVVILGEPAEREGNLIEYVFPRLSNFQ